MNNINTPINNENLLPKLKTPVIFYIFAALIVFLILMMFIIIYDVSPLFKIKSLQQVTSQTFTILFFSLLVVGICILFLPNLKEFKGLFEQIGSVTYVILYTIFAILFYTMVSKDILNDYSYIINPVMLALGIFSFYKGSTDNYVEKFNINYERIKSLILLFCLIAIIITFYHLNPNGYSSTYFGYSLLVTIIIAVFALLYVIILMTLPSNDGKMPQNSLANFTSYGTILFMLFLICITIFMARNSDSLFANKNKTAAFMILLLVICILWSTLLSINLFSDFTDNTADNNKLSFFKNSLYILFGLVISGVVIYWIAYNIESLSGKSDMVSFILNLLIVILILGIIYKTININSPNGDIKNNSLVASIFNNLLYIPSIVGKAFDWIGEKVVGEYNASNAGSFMMLGIAIALLTAYFKTSSLLNFINVQGGKQLVNKPVFTDTEYNLGSYQDLNGSEEFNYKYAISCWVYVDSVGPNTNANYNKFTSLLNFGDKPNILYNGKTHTLMITMQQKNLKDVTKNKLIDFDDRGNRIIYVNTNFLLQKWNNIIINYNGGTLDIFLNGELVKSSIEVVPYFTFDNLTIGENGGIKGGICNVVYFRHALTSQNIYFLYNAVKDRTIPTLNDSNETITVKNLNQTIKSIDQ